MSRYTECKGKSIYKNRGEAEKWRHRLERRNRDELRIYGCRFCGFFHLTSQLAGGRRRRSGEGKQQ